MCTGCGTSLVGLYVLTLPSLVKIFNVSLTLNLNPIYMHQIKSWCISKEFRSGLGSYDLSERKAGSHYRDLNKKLPL